MSRDVEAYREAARRAESARSRFLADLGAAKTSVSPSRLKAEIREGARERAHLAAMSAKRGVRRHGWSIAAAIAALAAWRFRRPLAALSQRLWVEARTLWTEYKNRRHEHEG